MPDHEEAETVVEDTDEDGPQGEFNQPQSTTASKPQSTQSQGPVPMVVDEAEPSKKVGQPSVETTPVPKASEDVADKPTNAPVEKVVKYKLKEENRIPQARFNQVVRQRKIAEQRATQMQQEHLELLDYLDRFQKSNPTTSFPEELTTRLNAKKKELQEARQAQHTARLDEADAWFIAERKKYEDAGFQFPVSLERELVAIVEAENLRSLDPLDAYQKAFKLWADENISSVEESPQAETSKGSDPAQPSGNLAPKQIRAEQKSKATGVPKAKAPVSKSSKSKETSETHHYYAVDEEPNW